MLITQPTLSDSEWTLILQLLEAERKQLPVELRHTDSPTYSDALGERQSMVESLVEKLRSQGIH